MTTPTNKKTACKAKITYLNWPLMILCSHFIHCLPLPSFFCNSSANNAAAAFAWVPCTLLYIKNKK